MKDNDSIFGVRPEKLDRLLRWGLRAPQGPPLPAQPLPGPPVLAAVGAGQPGRDIGDYKLLSVLGEGGGGIVYLAEQQRPVKRRVALKLIKPGMDTRQVVARFEAERQALALLDHPNIAHVYDAGATEAGRPYFAMEYVKGVPILEHCDRQKLTIEERLRLFLEVCEAIQHAHQKGIIHRDIKPSNILVLVEGDKAVPKVIDFGVAKALSQPLTERTLVTEQGQFVGTPEYISPEQAELTAQDIDTRSDIYSLGVVLYELLTGVLPFDPKTLREGGLDQTRRRICREEPKTPSTRLTALGKEAKLLAADRRTDVASLAKRLHGELEWIPLKAMRKDRTRRYRSASELADDIRNYLAGNPLIAGPETASYRIKKFVRKHAAAVATVLFMGTVLLLGFVVSTAMYVRAERARQKETDARAEAQRSQANESQLRRQAEARELTMRQLAYASDMSGAQEALARNDLGRARRLLDAHRPAPGEVDLRGWEWRYLWQQSRSDALGELCRYPTLADSLAYSPDGKLLAVAGDGRQGFVDIWDVPCRTRIKALLPKEGHAVAFSPQGDLLATGVQNEIRFWRTGTWDLVHQLTVSGRVKVFKFSPDGKWLVGLSLPSDLTMWEVDGWSVVRRVPGVRRWGTHIGRLDFSPDSKTLVIGDADGHLEVVDLASGTTNFRLLEAHPEGITSVAWSPTGSLIASGSGYADSPIHLWDAASGKHIAALEGHTSWISELIFSRDGLRLYSASGDQTIRIWDIQQQQCLATLRGSRQPVLGLALAPDGTTLASNCWDGVVALWSALPRAREEQPRLIDLGPLHGYAFAPDSRVLAVTRPGTVSLVDLTTSKEVEQLPALGPDALTLAYSPDGRLLASGSSSGRTRVWSCAEHRLLQELGDPNVPNHLFGFPANGQRLLSGAIVLPSPPTRLRPTAQLIWWDALTWQPVRSFEVEPYSVGAVSPDGCLLVVGTVTGAVCWLDAETGEPLARSSTAHHARVGQVALSRDGTQAASVADEGTAAIWDLSSFQPIYVFRGHMLGVHGVAFSPDGRRLATGSNGREAIKLWDLSTRRELITLAGQGSSFSHVGFSPDGRWLAAHNMKNELHLWHAPSLEEIEAAEKESKSSPSPESGKE